MLRASTQVWHGGGISGAAHPDSGSLLSLQILRVQGPVFGFGHHWSRTASCLLHLGAAHTAGGPPATTRNTEEATVPSSKSHVRLSRRIVATVKKIGT